MRKRFGFGFVISIVVIVSMMLPVVAHADTSTFSPQSGFNRTYMLSEEDKIEWDWAVVGDGELDFWIQDQNGTKYELVDEGRQDNGSFVVPSSGDWTIYLWNDNTGPPSVTVDFTITIEWSKGLPPWAFIIIGTLLIIVGVATLASLARGRNSRLMKPPWRPPEKYYPPQPPDDQGRPPQQPPSK